MPARNWLWLLLCILPITHGVNKMCNVCVATACVQRGARLFENAILELKSDDVTVNQAGCIRKCGKGVVFKAFGGQLEESAPNGLIGWYPVVDDENEAVRAAVETLVEMDGLDAAKLDRLDSVLAAGARALTQSEPPKFESRCEHCNAGLVSSRTSDTCVACGGTGERVGRGAFGRDDLAWAPRGDIVPQYAYDPSEYEPIEVECPDWLSAGDLVPFSTDDGDRIEVVAPEWARSGGTFWVAVDASGEWAPVER